MFISRGLRVAPAGNRGGSSSPAATFSACACGGGKSLCGASTIFGQHAGMPSDEHMLALRQVDQLRTDMAQFEAGQEFLMQQINRLPTARDLWRAATLIGLVGAVLGIVGIEAFWRYFACGSI